MANPVTQDHRQPAATGTAPVAHRRRFEIRSLGEVGALVVLVVVFGALNPSTFLSVGNLQKVLDQAATPLIVGVGATLVILMGCIDLSVEGVMGAAGMTFILTTLHLRGGVESPTDLGFLSFVLAVLVGAALGAVNGLIHTRLKVPSFIVTLGVWFVGLGIGIILFGTSAQPNLSDAAAQWPTRNLLGLPHSFWLAVVVAVLGVVVTRYTKLGRFAYAIGNNEDIARSNGIPVRRIKLYVFVLAGAFSGLAGILAILQLGQGTPSVGASGAAGSSTLFLTIAAVVIGGTSLAGGRGGILRTVLGVFLLTILNNGLLLAGVDPGYRSGVSGLVLILAIVAAAWPLRSRLRIVK
ncbi:sugar ABC transporter permease [Nakamurella endophytica]|uniref:Sugar ABC transporter permease n=2 Tax=Nakamurella endophytica TaxID=1748367 RepID=A0A917WFF5_9ACTN|nr:sugar ABC transporter permease [Nakamurella endophytica]